MQGEQHIVRLTVGQSMSALALQRLVLQLKLCSTSVMLHRLLLLLLHLLLLLLLMLLGWRSSLMYRVRDRRHIPAQDLGRGCLLRHLVGQRLRRLRCDAPLAPWPGHALALYGGPEPFSSPNTYKFATIG